MNEFFSNLITIIDSTNDTLQLADRLAEFEKTDIYKKQEASNKEFANRIYEVAKPMQFIPVIKVECRSKQHIKSNQKAFMPR